MTSPRPSTATPWRPLTAHGAAELLAGSGVRWWLSGGVALDQWLGRTIRERPNTDVSTVATDLGALVSRLPETCSAWLPVGDGYEPLAGIAPDADLQSVLVHDDDHGAWALQVNVEDGAPRAWVYKRDPRLQLPWDRAILDVDGIPTGAPEVQLVWKALRPRPEDDLDKQAVLPALSDEARAWYEHAILSIHPHSSWSIHVRSPFAPAKASWNRSRG